MKFVEQIKSFWNNRFCCNAPNILVCIQKIIEKYAQKCIEIFLKT